MYCLLMLTALIAWQDPFYGGDAVYTARVLLLLDPEPVNFERIMEGWVSDSATPEIELFPNPAGNMVTAILLNVDSHPVVLNVIDISGKVVQSQIILNPEFEFQFSVAELTNGFYTCEIKFNNETLARSKLIVQH